jgi:hypothetical protein
MEPNATPASSSLAQMIDLSLVDLPEDARSHDPAALELLAQDIDKNGQLQEIILLIL